MRIILKNINSNFSNKFLKYTKSVTGKVFLAHHGIQRSGTNYLNECLWLCGNSPINSFDENRNSPRHKHCRWYANKNFIPSFLIKQYGNNFCVNSLDELNKIAEYPTNTIHLVIKKEIFSWLASISNWGLHCNWFKDKYSALNNLSELILDYKNYYSFWHKLEKLQNERVYVLSFEEINRDFNLVFNNKLKIFLGLKQNEFNGFIKKVNMSHPKRIKQITRQDIIKELQNFDLNNLNA